MEVLEKLDEILNNILPDICSCDQLDASNKNVQSKFIVCNILKFLCLLLKSSKDKRYFLSLQVDCLYIDCLNIIHYKLVYNLYKKFLSPYSYF